MTDKNQSEAKKKALGLLVEHIQHYLIDLQGGKFGPCSLYDLNIAGMLHTVLENLKKV